MGRTLGSSSGTEDQSVTVQVFPTQFSEDPGGLIEEGLMIFVRRFGVRVRRKTGGEESVWRPSSGRPKGLVGSLGTVFAIPD